MKPLKSILCEFCLMVVLLSSVLLSAVRFSMTEGDAVTELELSPQDACFICVRFGDEPVTMDLEEYVVGVVLSEMPAEFEAEALKAQAVVARTYAWNAVTTGGKHHDGSICTKSTCCQGYLSPQNYVHYYGTEQAAAKIYDAVYSTAGTVITYLDKTIEATYFSSAGGFTEDAVAVWGNDYPYLLSTDSPEEVQTGQACKIFSKAYLEANLRIRLEENPDTWFHHWEFTKGGGVASVGVGNRTFSGTELRKLLGLRSTVFTVTTENDIVFFHTRGNGHRVGMSQYGANAMAQAGMGWEEIVTHYYTGVELKQITGLEVTAKKENSPEIEIEVH